MRRHRQADIVIIERMRRHAVDQRRIERGRPLRQSDQPCRTRAITPVEQFFRHGLRPALPRARERNGQKVGDALLRQLNDIGRILLDPARDQFIDHGARHRARDSALIRLFTPATSVRSDFNVLLHAKQSGAVKSGATSAAEIAMAGSAETLPAIGL